MSEDSPKGKGTLILLDGIPGSGKSLLAKSLKAMLDDKGKPCKVYIEECDEEKLDQYIRDMEKYAYSFQLETALDKCKIEDEAVVFAESGGIAIVDRSLMGDSSFTLLHYANGFISANQLKEYTDKVFGAGSTSKSGNDKYDSLSIYLSVKPEIALERIRRRGTQAEKDEYTVEYLRLLDMAFREVSSKVRIMEFNWDKELPVVNGVIPSSYLHDTFKNGMLEKRPTVSSDRDQEPPS